MKLNKINILLLISILLFSGCAESFLDEEPRTKPTEDGYYSTFEKVDELVTATYSRLCFMNYDISSFITPNAIADDGEVGGGNAMDGASWKAIDRFAHDPGNPEIQRNWSVNYKGIRLANTALHYFNLLENGDAGSIRQRIGEMKFMRAFYHFELLRFFGGVPIIDHVLDADEYYFPRNNIAEVLHFIQKDLEEAIPDLPLASQLGEEVGRANKGAAQALLARAYLYESSYAKNWSGDARFGDCTNKYEKALQMSENVINSNEYKLVGIDGERFDSWWGKQADGVSNKTYDGKINAFRWIFSVAGDNSKESVFEVQNIFDDYGWSQSRGNALTIFTSCRFTNIASNDYGWGFNVPAPYLLRAFANSDNRETDLSPENKEVISENTDPRYFTTVGKAGDDILVKYNPEKGLDASGSLVWAQMVLTNVPSGTASRKYEAHPDETILNAHKSANESGPINWKQIRYADVILIAAEAAFESGNKTKALEYVNMVRKRARNCSDNPGGSIYPKDLTNITFGDIVHERRIEFAMEAHRFYDLVRWNLVEQYLNDIELALNPGQKLRFIKGRHEFLPIPADQVQLGMGTLEQYDGWK